MPAVDTSVENFLRSSGPSLSSTICAHLVRAERLTAEAARKRVSRATGDVRRLTGFAFAHNERFCYLTEQWRSPEFWESLMRVFQENPSAYSRAISGCEARGGMLPVELFHVASGSPRQLKKHLSSESVIERLLRLGLLESSSHPDLGECVRFALNSPFAVSTPSALRGRWLAEEVLINAIHQWVRRLGFASYDSVTLRNLDKAPEAGQFRWDVVGPCYLSPMVTRTKGGPKPGFFVADVVLGRTLSRAEVAPFLHKCTTIRSNRNMRPFLSMLVADGFDTEAFDAGRKEGLVMATPENLFGKEIAAALAELIRTLTNAAAVAAANPDAVTKLLSRLGAIEGSAANLRGALFEMIVGHCVLQTEGGSIDLGKEVSDSKGRAAEIDVLLVKGNQAVRVYECKGKGPSNTASLAEVEEWREKKVPIIWNWIASEKRFSGCEVGFEFWCPGGFAPDALPYLEHAQKKTKRYELDWKDGPGVLEYAKKVKVKSIVEALNEHYFRHPLSRQK